MRKIKNKKVCEYEKRLNELAAKSVRIVYTDAQNIRIMEELNEGMEEFCRDQRRRNKEAEIESAGIILNA